MDLSRHRLLDFSRIRPARRTQLVLALLSVFLLQCRSHGSHGTVEETTKETTFGKSFDSYISEAKQAMAGGDWISAGVLLNSTGPLYLAAKQKGEPSATEWDALRAKFEEKQKDAFPMPVDREAGVYVFSIEGVPIGGTINALCPKVLYINPSGVDDAAAMDRLAEKVHAVLRARSPGFPGPFSKVIYVGAAERPDPDKSKLFKGFGTLVDGATGRVDHSTIN